MTKYILHGGGAKKDTDNNKKFLKEITANLTDSATILVVCYAKEEFFEDEVLEADKKTFSSVSPEKNLNLILADRKTGIFLEQIKNADAIYMHGGDSHILKEYLEKIPDLKNVWKNKIIAGTSAGAAVLAKYFYENDDDTYNKGLGILPFKLFCHYSEENSGKLEKLKRFGEDIETRAIPEEKFFVVER